LILGLLKAQSQHGYKINEFIEHNLGRVSDMKKSTAYAILKRLEHAGFVVSTPGQEGNRPTKRIYSITPQGEAKFDSLLREVLSSASETAPAGDIGVMFVDNLPASEAAACLEQRLRKVERQLSAYQKTPRHGVGMGVDLAIRHQIRMLEADKEWLLETIATLRKAE
jgi:DNA-binding PadR family transcriptional regulator